MKERIEGRKEGKKKNSFLLRQRAGRIGSASDKIAGGISFGSLLFGYKFQRRRFRPFRVGKISASRVLW